MPTNAAPLPATPPRRMIAVAIILTPEVFSLALALDHAAREPEPGEPRTGGRHVRTREIREVAAEHGVTMREAVEVAHAIGLRVRA